MSAKVSSGFSDSYGARVHYSYLGCLHGVLDFTSISKH